MSVTIGNTAITDEGLPVERVHVFQWSTGEGIQSVVPASDGSWSAQLLEDVIGVTYLASGKIPQTHGPYNFIPENAAMIGDEPVFINDDIVLIG